ncbi:MAG: nuclear transport factor 2 family protein [Ilumatobacteraceae bacterium]
MATEPLDDAEVAALRRLIDRQAIDDCIHRYARGLDRRDETLLRSAYHPDAVEDHGPYVGGVDGLVTYLLQVHERFPGYQRHVTTRNVEIDGDQAHAESYFVSIVRREGAAQLMVTAGRYVDRLDKREGDWKIANRVTVLEWHGALDGGAIDGDVSVAPRLDRDDVSYQRPLQVTRPPRNPLDRS